MHMINTGGRRIRAARALFVTLLLVAWTGIAAPASAQEPIISTPYPSVSVEPGATASFDLLVRADDPVRVDLSLEGVPEGWSATLRGGGSEVSSVFAEPEDPPEVTLEIDVPEDAEEGTTRITVVGDAGGETGRLPLDVSVVTAATGRVTLTTDVPARGGTADEAIEFSLDLDNDTPQQLTFELRATGPRGWLVSVEPSGEADATSVAVDARGSETLNVSATPPPQATEGDYPILVEAVAGDHAVAIELVARVTGRVAMEFSTSDQRLNATAVAGAPTELEIVVLNTGTAALTGLSFSEDAPTEWEVTFDPGEVAQVGPGQSASATAVITPSTNAVAGDYLVGLTASADGVEQSIQVRVTVETSPVWAAVGIGLILLTLGGMVWIFRRYGRR